MPRPVSYKAAGVDLAAGDRLVERIRSAVRQTYGPRVVGRLGGFAGLFRLDYRERLLARNYRDPLLVACADGVGSKLLLAIDAARNGRPEFLRTLGIDLVAMNVNDLITTGAEPLFLLDYVAVHKLDPAAVADLIAGIADGCVEAGCALLGGETAELPDLYRRGHFDLAGFAVGVVERRRLVDPRRALPGDVVLGLASSGVHSNGFALVRHLLLKQRRLKLAEAPAGLGEPLADALLRPTRIYAASVLAVLRNYRRKRVINGMAHITGGGLPGNLPRAVPDDCDVVLRNDSWTQPPVFGLLRDCGVPEREMRDVFNLGIGYALIVRPAFARSVAATLRRRGEQVFRIGVVRPGTGRVVWS